MTWDLPLAVEIDGKSYPIRNKCDYRVVLDIICALNDNELTYQEKVQCALFIFYEDLTGLQDAETAIKEMFRIIENDEQNQESEGGGNKPRLMDWEYDFKQLAPPVSRILGYDVRTPDKYTHWYTFLGAYMEIGECTFSTVISIRSKRAKGKRLEKWEQDFYNENRKLIDLPQKLTKDEEEFLFSDW